MDRRGTLYACLLVNLLARNLYLPAFPFWFTCVNRNGFRYDSRAMSIQERPDNLTQPEDDSDWRTAIDRLVQEGLLAYTVGDDGKLTVVATEQGREEAEKIRYARHLSSRFQNSLSRWLRRLYERTP